MSKKTLTKVLALVLTATIVCTSVITYAFADTALPYKNMLTNGTFEDDIHSSAALSNSNNDSSSGKWLGFKSDVVNAQITDSERGNVAKVNMGTFLRGMGQKVSLEANKNTPFLSGLRLTKATVPLML